MPEPPSAPVGVVAAAAGGGAGAGQGREAAGRHERARQIAPSSGSTAMDDNRRIMGVIRSQLAAIRRRSVNDRIDAIWELKDKGDPLAGILLLHLLDDPSSWVRERASGALFELGGTMARIAA